MKNQTSPLAPRRQRDYAGVLSSILAILAGLLVGLIVLLATNPSNAFPAFSALITGGFYSGMKTFGNVLYYAVPIIMTGLGVGFGFKASIFNIWHNFGTQYFLERREIGIFNIGGAGQFIVGAFCGVYTASVWNLPGALGWIVPLLASMIGGALWALLPGLLHAYRRVNIVIATIMMNYIGMYLVNYLIKIAPIYDNVKNQTRPVPAAHRLPTAGLEKLFPDSSANIGIFIVIVVAIIVYILLEKTNFGFELKACGKNRDASIGFGVDAKRMIMTAMLISGALIGLGGALLYLSSAGKYIKVEDVQAAEGMNGIPVALLAMNHPIGIIFTGIFIAYMQVSGFYMQTYGFTTEIVDIIVSVIVYFSAFSFIIREGIRRWQLRQRTDVHHTGKGAEK